MHAVLADDADAQMVRFLVENGANPNAADRGQKWIALHFAARDQKLPIVAALLDSGAIIDAEDSFGNTPLWRCVMEARAQADLVRLLLSKGADPQKKNRHGASPRDIAERTGKAELLNLLSCPNWQIMCTEFSGIRGNTSMIEMECYYGTNT